MPPKSKTPKKKDADKQPPVDEKFPGIDISSKDPRTVVLMLDSPEFVIVCKAAEVLQKYAEKSEANCLELNSLGIAPVLVKLLASLDKGVRSFSVICLATLSAHAEVRLVLLKIECIPSLLKLCVSDEELITQERASFTIAQLAGEYTFKIRLAQALAQEPLVKLAQSTDPDIQRNCLKTLSLMAEYFETRPALLEAEALPLFLDSLKSEYATIQELAMKAIHSCSHHSGCRKAMIEGEGLAKIVGFLGNSDWSDLHTLAVSILGLILEDAESMTALQGSGLLQTLLGHIKDSTVAEVKTQSAKTLSKAATNSLNRKILHEQEIEKTFLELVSSDDPGVVTSACDGLTEMALLASSRAAIGAEGGVGTLAGCLGREDSSVKASSARTLATIINDAPANCKLLEEAGGVEMLVALLSDTYSQCRRYAADCLAIMAVDEALRNEIVNAGAIPSLVDCLSFTDNAVRLSSMAGLGMLCCDYSARLQLLEANGIAPMLVCLQSTSNDLVEQTAWSISVAAQSSEIATAVGQLGGLELIQKLCVDSSADVYKRALNSLLSSNAAAKYWLTGHLDHTDVLTDTEFFDAGPAMSSSQSFTALSELLSQPVTGHQPVLTVSLLAKPPPEEPPQQIEQAPSTGSTNNRSKSRAQGPKETKKKSKSERDGESRVSERSEDGAQPNDKLPGLLAVDTGLHGHIAHTKDHIRNLKTVQEQVSELAKYVAECFGGPLERTGSFGFELPEGHIMKENDSNIIPLGKLTAGGFRHRALLFKVLCDQLGIPCCLVRGEYGRHWNEVLLRDGSVKTYLVDLVYSPGACMEKSTPSAVKYQHI